MGATFGNIHVRAEDPDAQARVAAAIRSFDASRAASNADDMGPSRIVGPTTDGWVAVYDSAIDNLDEHRLQALLESITSATRYPAVGALVFDDDVLILALAAGGSIVDEVFRTRIDMEDLSAADRDRGVGDPEIWSSVLSLEHPDELARAFAGEPELIISDTLATIAEAVGIPLATATLGHRYAYEVADLSSFIVIEGKSISPIDDRRTEGPVRLGEEGYGAWPSVQHRAPLEVTLTCLSLGAAAVGGTLTLWGDAIANRLVGVDSVDWYLLGGRTSVAARGSAEVESGDDEFIARVTAAMPDLVIPNDQEGIGVRDRLFVVLSIKGRTLAQGSGNLHANLTAGSGPGARDAEWEIPIVITP
jgi:hypothetical protein